MDKVIYEKRNRIGLVMLNSPKAFNAHSSLGDFSEARERLAQFYAKGKNRETA